MTTETQTSEQMLREQVGRIARESTGHFLGTVCQDCDKTIHEIDGEKVCGGHVAECWGVKDAHLCDEAEGCKDGAHGEECVLECDDDDCEPKGCGDAVEFEPYDIRYVVNSSGDLIGVHLMLAGGGPTIWLHAYAWGYVGIVGSWAFDSIELSGLADGGEIVDHYEDYFPCIKPEAPARW